MWVLLMTLLYSGIPCLHGKALSAIRTLTRTECIQITLFPLGGHKLIAKDYVGPDIENDDVREATRRRRRIIMYGWAHYAALSLFLVQLSFPYLYPKSSCPPTLFTLIFYCGFG